MKNFVKRFLCFTIVIIPFVYELSISKIKIKCELFILPSYLTKRIKCDKIILLNIWK